MKYISIGKKIKIDGKEKTLYKCDGNTDLYVKYKNTKGKFQFKKINNSSYTKQMGGVNPSLQKAILAHNRALPKYNKREQEQRIRVVTGRYGNNVANVAGNSRNPINHLPHTKPHEEQGGANWVPSIKKST